MHISGCTIGQSHTGPARGNRLVLYVLFLLNHVCVIHVRDWRSNEAASSTRLHTVSERVTNAECEAKEKAGDFRTILLHPDSHEVLPRATMRCKWSTRGCELKFAWAATGDPGNCACFRLD